MNDLFYNLGLDATSPANFGQVTPTTMNTTTTPTSTGGSLLSYLQTAVGGATGILGALNGNRTTTPTTAAAPTTPTWLKPVLLIGGGLVLIFVLFKAFK